MSANMVPRGGTAADDRAPSRRHVPALDGVRGIAILLVMIHNLSIHEHGSGLLVKGWQELVDAGWIGVQLFFVLSGFLITGILLDDRNRPRALRTFYIRRSLRIWPLYYAFMLGYAAIALWHLDTPTSYVVWYMLYLSNWADIAHGPLPGVGHFWSLAVEEQFYLTWPWLATKVRPATLAWACLAIAIAALVTRLAMHGADLRPLWIYESTATRADALALGALVAVALRNPQWRHWMERWTMPAVTLSALGLLLTIAKTHGLERANAIVEVFGYGLLSLLFAAWIARLVTAHAEDTRMHRLLCNPWLRAAGRYSYAAYIFHFPLKVVVLDAWDLRPWEAVYPLTVDIAFIVTMAALSFAAARVTYVVIEHPFLRLKDRWAAR